MAETVERGDAAAIRRAVRPGAIRAAPVERAGMVAMEEMEDKVATLRLSTAPGRQVALYWIHEEEAEVKGGLLALAVSP